MTLDQNKNERKKKRVEKLSSAKIPIRTRDMHHVINGPALSKYCVSLSYRIIYIRIAFDFHASKTFLSDRGTPTRFSLNVYTHPSLAFVLPCIVFAHLYTVQILYFPFQNWNKYVERWIVLCEPIVQ